MGFHRNSKFHRFHVMRYQVTKADCSAQSLFQHPCRLLNVSCLRSRQVLQKARTAHEASGWGRQTSTFLAWLFENHAHDVILREGPFSIRSLLRSKHGFRGPRYCTRGIVQALQAPRNEDCRYLVPGYRIPDCLSLIHI